MSFLPAPGDPGPVAAAGTPFDARLAALFAGRGAVPTATPILQRAEPYLDTLGEDLRRRIFLTRGEGGETLCLRPDFTVPVCLAHIANGASLPRRYSYNGLVFRQRRGETAEFRQAGVENLGEPNRAAADAATLADALAGLEVCGLPAASLRTVVGDQTLFEAFLAALALPAGWRRRLVRAFGRDDLLQAALAALSDGSGAPPSADAAVLRLARARDRVGLEALVAGRIEEGGLPPKRGRGAAEIAERLLEKTELADTRLDRDSLERLSAFLAVDCPAGEAPERLARLGRDAAFAQAIEGFAARNRALSEAGVDPASLRYRAAFGRPIDYYTGLVFETLGPASPEPLAGGGRYDRLVGYLGAGEPIPAVGFTLWLDRIGTALEARP
ncbi:ATP phosphoribosyltransferase regulatory subunit [Aureimonas sp. AU4]|uniref:ATP phosphoribosyltransferase regulatory subunit n=1 Tax=Aureimonas sp. AU4 TaxID=1638163 RepID=UPI0007848986|nr:ATP phosphoribosyltransferase regulatory subunit [Aureimonas sp. AU4]